MSDEDDLMEAENSERKKWLMKVPSGQEEEEEPKCEECEKLKFLVAELKDQLESEKKAMDEAIHMVERLEHDHKNSLQEQKLLLNFEKDKVIMLEKSLETERKARMEEIYKQDRKTKDFRFVEKDFERVQSMNMDMVSEFEAVKKENIALAEAARQLQDNKDSILQELQRYEVQVAELEANNSDLRRRLYNSDAERDRFQLQCDKLKAKLEAQLGSYGSPSHNMSSSKTLKPLRSAKSASRWPREHSHQLSQLSTSSTRSSNRISDLSTVNVIKKFNSDPRTIRYNQRKMPGLWPTAL